MSRRNMSDLAPHNPEAERAVLGALLIDGGAVVEIAPILRNDDFIGAGHQAVFDAVLSLHEKGIAVDVATIVSELGDMGRLEEAGGAAYIVGLIERTPVSSHARHYARLVRETSLRRQMIEMSGQFARKAYEGGDNERIIDAWTTALQCLREDLANGHTGEVDQYFSWLESPRPDGITCGLSAIDNWLGGAMFAPERLIALSGQTGVGKSWIQMGMMVEAARAGAKVIDFSLEMPGHQRVLRYGAYIHGRGSFLQPLIRKPESWTAKDTDFVAETHASLKELGIKIFPPEVAGVQQIEAYVRQYGADVVGIDYYGNLAHPERAANERQIDLINSGGLERISREASCTVLVVAQRNETDTNMHFGQHLKRKCDASIKLDVATEDTDVMDKVKLTMEKNRWGMTGGSATFVMDKSVGRLTHDYQPF